MNTFVLIMVLIAGSSTSRPVVVEAQFATFQACEIARKHIAKSIMKETPLGSIHSQGCYATGSGG